MNSPDKYILGGGLSGLIYAYYNPEYTVINKDSAGGMAEDHNGAMAEVINMDATPELIKLFEDLGVGFKKITLRIGYRVGGEMVPEITPSCKLDIIRKKLGKPDYEARDLTLAAEDYYNPVLCFDFSEMMEKLKKAVGKVKSEEVIRITDTHVVTQETSYQYSQVVNTLPADIFWRLYHKQPDYLPGEGGLESRATTFVLSDKAPAWFQPEEPIWNVVYIHGNEHPYVRVSRRDKFNAGRFLYEFPGRVDRDEVLKALPEGASILEYWVNPRAAVVSNKQNIPPRGILFVGRYAQWDHQVKLLHVMRQATFDCDFRTVWNRQMEFSARFYDYNRLNDPAYRDQITKDIILHVYPEIAEILDGINYKAHQNAKQVDVEYVKIEIIDAFKYLLNLMIIWRVDTREMFELFHKKSTIVEERWQKVLEARRAKQ